MSIGEFAKRSRLSPKALRIVGALRQLQVPPAEIEAIIDLEPSGAAARIDRYGAAAEVEHTARRELARYLVDLFNGKRSVMYEVRTRDVPARNLLCVKRNVDGQDRAWAFGKEFVALLREHPLPRVEGGVGAAFCIYWGEVPQRRSLQRPIPSAP